MYEDITFDSRGVYLDRARFLFASEMALTRSELAARGGRFWEDADHTWWCEFVLIPELLTTGTRYVGGRLHSHPPFETLQWELTFARAPSSEPPARIKDSALRGNFPDNLRELLSMGLPSGKQRSTRVRLWYYVDANTYPKLSELSLSRVPSPNETLTIEPKLAEWSIRNAEHLRGLTVEAVEDDVFSLLVRAEIGVTLSESADEAADRLVWEELKTCLG